MRRDLIALPDNSRVWIYQCKSKIDESHADIIKKWLYQFTMQWNSHGVAVESYAHLFHNKFIVFVADESNLVSGCSIDSSVAVLKKIEDELGLSFFDRLNYAYMDNDDVKQVSSSEFRGAVEKGDINTETLMFDNLVNNKKDFINDWLKPLDQSWYMKFIN